MLSFHSLWFIRWHLPKLVESFNHLIMDGDYAADPMPTGDNSTCNSILMPTIPIYQVQQSSTQAICSLAESFRQNSINRLNIDVSNSSQVDLDWSNSLFRPAARPTRRECKVVFTFIPIFLLVEQLNKFYISIIFRVQAMKVIRLIWTIM